MAKVTAGIVTSHVPAIGAAIDNGQTGTDYWKPLFKGFEFTKLEDGVKKGEFPQVDPQLMFKALGGLFMGLVFMGDRKEPVTDKDVENLLNELITDPKINN